MAPVINIFSPHIDDAFLSLGGSILYWIDKGHKVKVRNIFTVSEWVGRNNLAEQNFPLSAGEVTTMRKQEERSASQASGFDYEFWDFLDFPLRNHFSQNDTNEMISSISYRINECLNDEDYFFFPAAPSNGHDDHILVRSIGDLLHKKKCKLFYYEDLPYYSWGDFEFKKNYKTLKSIASPILQEFNIQEKERVLKEYASQVSLHMLKTMSVYSYNTFNDLYYERFWEVRH